MIPAIYERLSTYTAVSDLVGDRIYPTKAPQDAELPCIIQRRFGGQSPKTQAGACSITDAQHEIDILATSPSQALAVADAVRNAMDGLRSVEIGSTYVRSAHLTNETDSSILFQGTENERYLISQDWDFWYFRSIPTL